TSDGSVGCFVLNNSLAQFGRRYRSQNTGTAPIPAALIVQKIEQPVLLDRPANRRAEHIHQKRRTANPRPVVEKRVCRCSGVPMEIVDRTMEFVGPALRDQRNLRAGSSPLVGA